LGAGKKGSEEIKEHPFLAGLNWKDVLERKNKVPKSYPKKVIKQDI